jgi:plasma-membrane proton-efflux P-type ATPase
MNPSFKQVHPPGPPAVDPSTGLSSGEVLRAREVHGFNEVADEQRHPVLEFLGKFTGMSAFMLELILLISILLGKQADAVVITALLVVNAVIGFLQERRASGVVDALKRRLQVAARVLRDSTWQVVPARELVPGDIVRVRPGDFVPADLRLLSGTLSIDQSTLTGESTDVARSAGEALLSGSVVRRGEGDAIVVATGTKTLYGRTTELVRMARPKLHIEEVVGKLVRWLFIILALLLGTVLAVSALRGMPMTEILPLMLVLLMSAVPVALPVMFTVSMAVGSRELARRGVLVTRLSAAEDAATMDVLCVDKTGTVTMNRLSIAEVTPLGQATEDDVLLVGALASREANNDPVDMAFLAAAAGRGGFKGGEVPETISFEPFDPVRRRTEAVIGQGGQRFRVMKGAVRTIAGLCREEPSVLVRLDAIVADSAQKGYRTLAVARGPEAGDCRLIGLVSLYDPPRPEAAGLIERIRSLGIQVKMLTGDALAVAAETARLVGLEGIRRMPDPASPEGPGGQATGDVIEDSGGLAEVYPEDKYRVVQLLQQAGHVTGMTGDGVNDAPALRQAEVGIAVSTATDVAKGAASVVLTEPGLTNIVALVEQGRVIYQRILTWIINKISRTILKAGFVSAAFLMTGKFVVSAFTMLLLTFMTDFAKIALATDRVHPSENPETWKIGGHVLVSSILGVIMVGEALLLLYVCDVPFGLSEHDGRLYSFSFLTLLYLAVFSIVSVRERRHFTATMPGGTLLGALFAVALTGTGLTFAGLPGLLPLRWWQILAIFGYAMIAGLVVNDLIKVLLLRLVADFRGNKGAVRPEH